jgi:hypothetical protein
MFDTDAVFQLPMFALNAVVEENACEPTTRGPHRTTPTADRAGRATITPRKSRRRDAALRSM